MKHKKGQAALEFLTTYGWAFLVVLVMIGALAYFGVLNPEIFLPEKCVFGAGIGCIETQGTAGTTGSGNDGTIQAKLKNGFGYSLVIEDVEITASGEGGACIDCGADNCNMTLASAGGTDWATDGIKVLNISCSGLAEGSHPNVAVKIYYHRADGEFQKVVEGQIQVKPV